MYNPLCRNTVQCRIFAADYSISTRPLASGLVTVKDLHIGQNSVSFDGWLTLKTALMTALPKRPSRLSILHLDISERFGNVTFVSSFPISLTQNSLAMRNLSLTKSTLNGEPNSKNEGNK